jgi:hypothetical protein
MVLVLSTIAWAQQQPERAAGGQAQNPAAKGVQPGVAGQNRNQATSGEETIRGVISGITAEGEAVLDYRTNVAARAEGAFLTIVGSPSKPEAGNDDRRSAGSERNQQASSGKKRHNVYIAWLTPRTRVLEATDQTRKGDHNQRRNQNETQSSGERNEISFDQLEVGEHVEIQFSPQEESAANNNVHQNQQMRRTHGRHRTFVGFATAITVLPAKDHDKSSSAGDARSDARPQ